jgi:hypothetical protein
LQGGANGRRSAKYLNSRRVTLPSGGKQPFQRRFTADQRLKTADLGLRIELTASQIDETMA